MDLVPIDTFFARMKRLYEVWKAAKRKRNSRFSEMDCLVNAVDNFDIHTKSTAFAMWLFGNNNFLEHIMILTEDSIHIAVNTLEGFDFVKALTIRKPKETYVPKVKVHWSKARAGSINMSFYLMISLMRGRSVGIIPGGKYVSEWADSWKAAVTRERISTVDISTDVAYLLGQKEDKELECVQRGCFLMEKVFINLEQKIDDIVDNYTKMEHFVIVDGIIAVVNRTLDYAENDNDEDYSIKTIYPPIVQTSGDYCLKFDAINNSKWLHADVIVCSLGIHCKKYCSNIVRTLVKKPTKSIEQNYNLLLQIEEEILKRLKHNVKLKDVHEHVITFVQNKNPEMIKHLTDDFGFAMGTEFKDNSLIIGPEADAFAKKGMTFNVNVGLSNLINKQEIGKRGETYALWIGDTVLVNEDQKATLMTLHDKKWSSIAALG